jgi:FMN phosphatase YigB (HAD superfamily)
VSRILIPIDHIVFDIGKVLIAYDTDIPYRVLIPDEVERCHFLTEICSPAWNIEQDRGRSWAEAEAELIALHPDKSELIRAFRQSWHHMVGPEIPGTVALLRRFVSDGIDVTLLTNFASDTFRESQKRWPFLTETRGATVSGDAKLIKPDPAIYHLHVETFGLKPERTLFIDDSLPNVLAAHSCGWHAVQFTGLEALEADLAAFAFAK